MGLAWTVMGKRSITFNQVLCTEAGCGKVTRPFWTMMSASTSAYMAKLSPTNVDRGIRSGHSFRDSKRLPHLIENRDESYTESGSVRTGQVP
jgi:hypothetical protein